MANGETLVCPTTNLAKFLFVSTPAPPRHYSRAHAWRTFDMQQVCSPTRSSSSPRAPMDDYPLALVPLRDALVLDVRRSAQPRLLQSILAPRTSTTCPRRPCLWMHLDPMPEPAASLIRAQFAGISRATMRIPPLRADAGASASEAYGQASPRRLLRVFVGCARVGFSSSLAVLVARSAMYSGSPDPTPPRLYIAFTTIFSASPPSMSPSPRAPVTSSPRLFHAPYTTRQSSSLSAICSRRVEIAKCGYIHGDAGSAEISARVPHDVQLLATEEDLLGNAGGMSEDGVWYTFPGSGSESLPSQIQCDHFSNGSGTQEGGGKAIGRRSICGIDARRCWDAERTSNGRRVGSGVAGLRDECANPDMTLPGSLDLMDSFPVVVAYPLLGDDSDLLALRRVFSSTASCSSRLRRRRVAPLSPFPATQFLISAWSALRPPSTLQLRRRNLPLLACASGPGGYVTSRRMIWYESTMAIHNRPALSCPTRRDGRHSRWTAGRAPRRSRRRASSSLRAS
ncbi:hypothetical protein C8R45DRAFT_1073777 [Mycena sanguinolenta]|nr:hypothetical protein C8R45DRAFT_1073777 [Mycena sanguinolenta]